MALKNTRNIFNTYTNTQDVYHTYNTDTDGTLNYKYNNTNTNTNTNTKTKTKTKRRILINSPLNILQSEQVINRYTRLSSDDLVSTTQIYWFFRFFQWFALIVMIICAFFGIGVIFE